MSTVRLIPWAVGDGPSNMAADEALLVSAGLGVASLRFYGWSKATASLGYFQNHAEVRAQPSLAALPWVRRPSGGLTLVHQHELTYALALPAGADWQRVGESWLTRMHEVICAALREFGVESHLCLEPNRSEDVLCFLHHTPGDLLIGGHKVAGSAQRKARGTLMQHGSVLLHQSLSTPQLPGVAEKTGIVVKAETLADLIAEQLASRFGWSLELATWTESELRWMEELEESRYRSDEWNERR